MKEKQYFCDYWYDTVDSKKSTALTTVLSLVIITFISSIIIYNVLLSKYGNELNSYSQSTYEHLDQIADNVIQKGKGIDLAALPDDVVRYEIISEDAKVIFTYYLDNNKGMHFAESASMVVELSDNFEIISKKPNYLSEENYEKVIRSTIIFTSIMDGFGVWVVLNILYMAICSVLAYISKNRKNKDISSK